MNQKETVFVTGAAGFIGGRIIERLYLARQARVRAGIRRWSSAARIARFPIEIVKADVLNNENLPSLIKGSDYVVHCAYGNRRVTEEGTRNVLQAALEVGVKRVVHLSTVEVYGNVSGVVDESHSLKYARNEYADSKINAEKICMEFRRRGLSIIVLRPTIVYGPFSRLWSVRPTELLLSGWGRITGLDGICNHLYVDDLVSAILLSLSHKIIDNGTFNISGPNPITWEEYFDCLNDAIGLSSQKKRSLLQVSLKARAIAPLRWVGQQAMSKHQETVLKVTSRSHFLKRSAWCAERLIKSSPSSNELALFGRKARYSIDKAKASLGYSPGFDLGRGLELTAAWLKHHGFLP